MAHTSLDKSHREGMTLAQMMEMFPSEAAAMAWFESVVWPRGRCCGKCGSTNTREVPSAKPMPYWCPDCRSYFSVRTGTPMARSNVPMRKWAIAIYLCLSSLKSVSSMKLHRDIRCEPAHGVVHAPPHPPSMGRAGQRWRPRRRPGRGRRDVHGREAGQHVETRSGKELADAGAGRGPAGKTAVVGVKDRETNRVRAKVVERTDKATLQRFVRAHAAPDAETYTDETAAYEGLPNHDSVKHSVGEYVDGKVHTNGMESFWAMLKRAHMGDVPQDFSQAPAALRQRVRRQAQHPRLRHHRPDARYRRPAHRPEPLLPGPHPRQRA